ncbi:MAG TPA: hypothetical protein VL523_08020 [Terriglobia bacterium]|nr:hypothetical protein [Terriglobia bacterium]
MPSFSGKFQYHDPAGTGAPSGASSGACRLSFDEVNLTLTPERGAPWIFDLGDIDVFAPGDYELTLMLYTGAQIVLQQFGKVFQNLAHDLLEAYRKRLVQCLLLEDLEEITRFDGFARLESPSRAFSSAAEFRLYKSNLAVLPGTATGMQWRYSDLESVSLDASAYTVTLESGNERLVVSKLAKRTQEFAERVQGASNRLREQAAGAVHDLLPFLSPDQFRQAAALLAEGRTASLGKLQAISPKIEAALASNAVDARQKPYFDSLRSRVPAGWLYAGFKLLRQDEAEENGAETAHDSDAAGAEAVPQGDGPAASGEGLPAEERRPILYWFFFPLNPQPGARAPSNLVAWEATTKSGRATYFFRLLPPERAAGLADPGQAQGLVEAAIRELNRAIVLLNFRREPIYQSDDALALQPRFRRYAIACRKLPELRRLRASFLGRAIHTSPEAWQKQVDVFLAGKETPK